MKKKLGIIIPTCNRSESIEYLLGRMATPCKNYGIDIVIFDSSSNDRTENVVMNFRFSNKTNVIYDRYTGEYDGFSLDTKVMDAIVKYAPDYEYLWICHDGLIITIEDCYDEILSLLNKSPDFIVVDTLFRCVRNDIEIKKYQDCRNLCKEHFHRTVTLGMMILQSKAVMTMLQDYPLDETNYSLWLNVVPYWYAANRQFLAYFLCAKIFAYNPCGTRNSFWNKSGNAIKQWVFYYTKIVSLLPKVYDDLKMDLYHLDLYDFHPFRIGFLLRMRGNGGLTLDILHQYRTELELVRLHSIKVYYLLALCPKWVARYIVDHQESSVILKNMIEFYRLAFREIEG